MEGEALGPMEACCPRDTREVRQEWVGGWESTLFEAKERGMGWGFIEGTSKGDTI